MTRPLALAGSITVLAFLYFSADASGASELSPTDLPGTRATTTEAFDTPDLDQLVLAGALQGLRSSSVVMRFTHEGWAVEADATTGLSDLLSTYGDVADTSETAATIATDTAMDLALRVTSLGGDASASAHSRAWLVGSRQSTLLVLSGGRITERDLAGIVFLTMSRESRTATLWIVTPLSRASVAEGQTITTRDSTGPAVMLTGLGGLQTMK